MYCDYREPVAKIPSHRMLAIRRGEKRRFCHFEIELDAGEAAGVSEEPGPCASRATGRRNWRWRSKTPTSGC